jgi:hypothetical protein
MSTSSVPVAGVAVRLDRLRTDEVVFGPLPALAVSPVAAFRAEESVHLVDDVVTRHGSRQRYRIVRSAVEQGQLDVSWRDSAPRGVRLVQVRVDCDVEDSSFRWSAVLTELITRANRVGADQFVVTSDNSSVQIACAVVGLRRAGAPFGEGIWLHDLRGLRN